MMNRQTAALLLAIAVLVALAGCSSSGSGSGSPSVGSESGAQDVCEQFVGDRLKAPSTADFGDESTVGPGPAWTVRGSVDAENGFGAMLRNQFVCRVMFTGEDDSGENYILVGVRLHP